MSPNLSCKVITFAFGGAVVNLKFGFKICSVECGITFIFKIWGTDQNRAFFQQVLKLILKSSQQSYMFLKFWRPSSNIKVNRWYIKVTLCTGCKKKRPSQQKESFIVNFPATLKSQKPTIFWNKYWLDWEQNIVGAIHKGIATAGVKV